MPRCGARLSKRPGQFCRSWALKIPTVRGKRRCRKHGGMQTQNLRYNPWGEPQRAPVKKMQAVMRALGLSWHGGRPKQKAKLTMADKAIAVANEVLELLPASRDVPDDQKGSAELLGEGVRNGLLLTRDTVVLGRDLLARDGENVNLKFLGAANIAALGLVRLGIKAADTGSRNDIIGKLIAAIEAEKGATKGE